MAGDLTNPPFSKTKLPKRNQHLETGNCQPAVLHVWEEIIGKCTGFSFEGDDLAISLSVNRQQLVINIPKYQNASVFKSGLKLVGHKIGIMRSDNSTRQFVIRIIEKGTE
jgi:hypothetical protein